ncbi:MAG: hypothetical protein IJW81_07615 [Clostridia bacterium]|nr:hypothetical protein [Clostridia bacterium]
MKKHYWKTAAALLTAVLLTAVLLTACQNEDSGTVPPETTETAGTPEISAPADDVPAADNPAVTEAPEEGEKIITFTSGLPSREPNVLRQTAAPGIWRKMP